MDFSGCLQTCSQMKLVPEQMEMPPESGLGPLEESLASDL